MFLIVFLLSYFNHIAGFRKPELRTNMSFCGRKCIINANKIYNPYWKFKLLCKVGLGNN